MRHYSSSSWKNYIDGNIGSLERALMEEHLANCRECLAEYTKTLEASEFLCNAPEIITVQVMAAVSTAKPYTGNCNKPKQMRIKTFSRFAIAASIALMLWQFGVFGHLSMKVLEIDELFLTRPESKAALVNGFGDRMINRLNSFFNTITEKGDVLFNEKKK